MSAVEPLPPRREGANSVAQVARLLGQLRRREQVISYACVSLQTVWVVCAALVWVGVAPGCGVSRAGAAGVLTLVLGLGAFLAVGWPILRARSRGGLARQARLLEAVSPAMRGRLIATAERLSGPVGQESRELIEYTAARVVVHACSIPPGRVHPVRAIVWRVALTVVIWLCILVGLLLSPLGARGMLAWWSDAASVAEVVAPASADAAPTARFGDLVLRYVYPAYTGLEPKEVANSTGEAHAPPGTRIELKARSGDVLDTAAVEAYSLPPEAATLADGGRVVSGGFTMGAQPGAWRILATIGGTTTPSRDFPIVPEPDLPPEVILESADRVEVGLDQRVPIRWHARDDFGVRRVVLDVDGKEFGEPLATSRGRQAELSGDGAVTPRQLGLREGARVRVAVAAWDNDEVSGSKRGVSRTITLVVGGGESDLTEARRAALLAVLVEILAGNLEERWPPGASSAEFLAWGSVLSRRYEPLDRFVETELGGKLPSGIEGDAVRHVRRTGGQLIRYLHTAFPSGEVAPADADVRMADALRTDATVTLENEILVLDFFLRNLAFERIMEAAVRLGRAADDAEERLRQPMSAAEIVDQVDRLERRLGALQAESVKLNDKRIGELIESRSSEMRALSAEISASLESKDSQEANQLMARLAQQMGELADAIEDTVSSGQKKSEKALSDAKKLRDELEKLEKEQSELHDEVQKLRDRSDGANSARLEQLWQQAEAQSSQHRTGASDAEQRAPEGEAARRFAQDVSEQASVLEEAVQNRDLDRARAALDASQRSAEIQKRFGDRRSGQAADARLEQLERTLDQIERAAQQESGESRQALRGLQERQDQLARRLGEARQSAEKVGQSLPIQPQGMEDGLQQAAEGMAQAQQSIRQGQPMQAEGSQSSARQGISEARRALEQAMEQAQRPGGGGGGSGKRGGKQQQGDGAEGSQGGQGDEDGGGDEDADENAGEDETFIPVPEAFKTPEEYRRELLDGMEGEVPEEYRALKKRYYEELVNQ
jgi:hypothetical protein